ncbi:toll-like receptor Tollo [Ptychodera flava]|uniref:toll-like receptor Tollo n=1 Tax=Ptychodera flava TaxID=63121 RepID=UPI00396A7A34
MGALKFTVTLVWLVQSLSIVEIQALQACPTGCTCEFSELTTLLYNSVFCTVANMMSSTLPITLPPTLILNIHYGSGFSTIEPLNITEWILHGADLIKLDVYGFPLYRITEMDFPYLPNLLVLNITYCGTREVSPNVFQRFPKLKVLGMSGNSLSKVPSALTCIGQPQCDDHLPKQLKGLDLRANSIRRLQDSAFTHLVNLTSLNLGLNGLITLQEGIFDPLQNLQYLSLYNNAIGDMPLTIFQHLTNLEALDLGSNSLKAIDSRMFRNLINLKVLDISLNLLSTLPVDIFTGLVNLQAVSLHYNNMKTLPRDLFQDLPVVRYIDLSESDQEWSRSNLPADLIRNIPSLKTLNLKKTGIESLANLTFEGCTSLSKLDLSLNFIGEIPKGFLNQVNAPSVEYLYMQSSNISHLAKYAFKDSSRLREIDLSHNNLKTLPKYAFYRLSALKILDLSHNNIFHIEDESLYRLQDLQELKLNDNFLTNLNLFPYIQAALTIKTFLNMEANPLSCDCDMFTVLYKYNQTGYPRKQDLDHLIFHPALNSLQCHSPENVQGRSISSLEFYDFWCELPVLCPKHCTCRRQAFDTSVFLTNCSFQGFLDFPNKVWQYTTILMLQGNNITHISENQFENMTDLQELNLAMNSITWIEEGALRYLSKLTYFDLRSNKLQTVSGSEFSFMPNLQYLNLNFNNISHIHMNSFKSLRNLEYLLLDHNRLEDIDVGMFEMTTKLKELSVDHNPYVCTCQLWWVNLQEFILSHENVIPNKYDINCTTPYKINSTNKWPMLQLKEANLDCNDTDPKQGGTYHIKLTDMESRIIAGVLGLTAVVMVAMAAIFKFRNNIRVVVYSITGWRILEKTEVFEENKVYDAFLSFSSEDLDWVKNTLLKNLEEHDPPYKVCIHHRDFIVGACIAESIVEAIEQSSRTILVLTNNFLESEWCAYEFKQAHHQVLLDKSSRLIVLIMEDIDQDKLDRELKTYLQTNTYLEKEDPLFWEKLYYAMPHVKHIRKLNRPNASIGDAVVMTMN